jgi:DTW domain-containing protein YfiP
MITVNGVVFAAVTASAPYACDGCVAQRDSRLCGALPDCTTDEDVIFVLHDDDDAEPAQIYNRIMNRDNE